MPSSAIFLISWSALTLVQVREPAWARSSSRIGWPSSYTSTVPDDAEMTTAVELVTAVIARAAACRAPNPGLRRPFPDRGIEIGARRIDHTTAVHNKRAVDRGKFAQGLKKCGVVDVPRRLRVSLERVEHELAQVRRQSNGITQHEYSSDRRSFSTFSSKAQSDLQDSGEVAGHRLLSLVVLQPWKISGWLGDEKRIQPLGPRDAAQSQHSLVQLDVTLQGREKQRQVQLAQSAQGGIWHGQHDILDRVGDRELLLVPHEPDQPLVLAQLLRQAHVPYLVGLHNQGLDRQRARESEGGCQEFTRFLLFLPILNLSMALFSRVHADIVSCETMDRSQDLGGIRRPSASSHLHSTIPSTYTMWARFPLGTDPMQSLRVLDPPGSAGNMLAQLPASERGAARTPLPMSMVEMRHRGWDRADVVFVTGDAHIDHQSFAMAILGRVLEAAGFRVGIVSQPDWRSADDWRRFGRPRLFFAISAGNMDSMINHYTANRKVLNDDAYSPGGAIGMRPDRATLAYCQPVSLSARARRTGTSR